MDFKTKDVNDNVYDVNNDDVNNVDYDIDVNDDENFVNGKFLCNICNNEFKTEYLYKKHKNKKYHVLMNMKYI